MKKHFSLRIVPGDFSIYNQETNALVYRIKSYTLFGPERSELLTHPSKQVVGKLKIKRKGARRYVSFEVFNSKAREWMTGELIQYYIGWIRDSFDIEWNGPTINSEIADNRFNGTFRNDR
ncbi:unnamed protein product, partial [Rotaria sordida]